MKRFHTLADLQREDAERAEHRPGFWSRVTHWSKRAKEIGTIVSVGVTLIGGAIRVVQMIVARTVAPAEEPATGVASTALDRVEKPRAVEVDGGSFAHEQATRDQNK